MMDLQFTDLLREIEEALEKQGEVPRIVREAGQFLNLLVKSSRATRILVVGAADGYATLWLAEAAAATNGIVTAVESDVWQFELVREVLTRSPHAERIKLVQGDGQEVLPVLEGPFDFVLLDGDKTQTLHFFHILAEKTTSGALICCDKAISEAAVLTEYLGYVHERPGLESVLVPIGDGIEMTYRLP